MTSSPSSGALNTSIFEAVLRQKNRLVRFYAGWNNDIEYRVQGLALVHIAVLEDDAALLADALAHGMSPNTLTDTGDTALHILARKRKTPRACAAELLRVLRESGANLYARNARGCTPLDTAVEYDNSIFMSLLRGSRPTHMLKRDWSLFEQWHPALPTPVAIKDEPKD